MILIVGPRYLSEFDIKNVKMGINNGIRVFHTPFLSLNLHYDIMHASVSMT